MIVFTKIFAVFLALLVISKTLHDFKKKKENIFSLLFWSIAWLFIVYVALFPKTFYEIGQDMANNNVGMGTFVGIAFVFLFFLIYRMYIKSNRIERQIKEIVIKIGLKDIEEDIKEK